MRMRWQVGILMGVMVLAGCALPARGHALPGGPGHEKERKLYAAKCAKCHKLYDPAKYSDAEWAMWLGKMSKKSKLTSEQQQNLARYIEETIRHPAASDRLQ